MSLVSAIALAAAAACSTTSPAHTVALVELYTSQGCSSCPPADRWLSRIGATDRAIPLALHVGYWDYIGWKDPFAKREFNDRQRRLAQVNGSRSVYTPGVFVGARETPRWSDAATFDAAVRAVNARAPRAALALAAGVEGDRLFARVDAHSVQAAAPQVTLALVQGGLSTAVRAGENRGETLRNDHVVREWSGPFPVARADAHQAAAVRWALPAGARPAELSVVAFAQDAASGEILQAVQLPLAKCGG
jgi:hypothetical protein